MNENDLVSVIIPVYNAESYLTDCINSVLKQTYSNYEIILIDDGSKDSSKNISLENEKKYSNVHVYSQRNQGPSVARSTGVSMSNGVWCVFVDADDEVSPSYISSLMKYANDDIDVVFAPMKPNELLRKEKSFSKIEYLQLHLRNWTDPGPCCKLFRKRLLSKDVFEVPSGFRSKEDWVMNIRVAQKINKAVECPEFLYIYRVNENSLVHTFKFDTRKALLLNKLMNESIVLSKTERKILRKDLLLFKFHLWKYVVLSLVPVNIRRNLKALIRRSCR